MSLTIHGISFELTKSRPDAGSKATPPHSAPPSKPGNTTVPSNDGGSNIPERMARKRFSTSACASGVRVVSIASVRPCRANGAGFTGRGCVGEANSPSTRDGGTGRSSIGKSEAPVFRSSTNVSPYLVTCATASIWRPSRVTVTSVGGAGKSQSQMSCFTPWKCQMRLPVRASSASTQSANRLSPWRVVP